MVAVTKHGIILEKTGNSFENEGVCNPAIYQEENTIHMFYQAVHKDNFSSIGYCKLDGPLKVIERSKKPIISPKESSEFHGIEEPRIVKIEDTYYLSYAVNDNSNIFGHYSISKDLKAFDRRAVITPKFKIGEFKELMDLNYGKISPRHFMFYNLFERYKFTNLLKKELYARDSNLVFFPKKINQKLALLHMLYPSIQIVYFKDPSELTPEFWKKYISNLHKHIVLAPKLKHENCHIGAGCPPIETEQGWLFIYHSVQITAIGFVCHVCAALFDLENPKKLISRLKEPLFSPTEPWEKEGNTNNVVFPTGTAIFNDQLYIYYGAAGSRVAVASVNINSLLKELKNQERKK